MTLLDSLRACIMSKKEVVTPEQVGKLRAVVMEQAKKIINTTEYYNLSILDLYLQGIIDGMEAILRWDKEEFEPNSVLTEVENIIRGIEGGDNAAIK